jgi:hypothetical protein
MIEQVKTLFTSFCMFLSIGVSTKFLRSGL